MFWDYELSQDPQINMQFDNYLLRPIESKDADAFFHLIDNNRKRLEDFFAGTVSRNKTIEETNVFVPDVIQRATNKTYFPFVLVDKINDAVIGYVDIKSVDWSIPKAEVGYFIDKKYENRGITCKALAKIIVYAFDELEMHKLFLRTHESNIGSIRIAEKNGFTKEGMIRSDYKMTSGVIIDVIYYGLLKEEFRKLQ